MHPSLLIQVIELIHRRRARRGTRQRSLPQRALNVGAILLGVFGLAASLLAIAVVPLYSYAIADLPQVGELETLLDPQTGSLLQATRFYDRSGQHLLLTLQPPGAERVFVDGLDTSYLADAFVAANDPKFWDRGGFHWPRLNEGPSSLSGQLAAKMLLAGEPDDWRKNLRAWLLESAASEHYSREQILTWSLNSATFGHGTFGADSGAHFYFGKAAADLTLGEAAMLAALSRAPEINLVDAPDLARQFKDLVLVAMREQEAISEDELNAALAEEINIIAPSSPASAAPEFTDFTIQQLTEELGSARVERGGLDVITTLDYPTQQEIAALASGNEVTILDPINGRIVAMLGSAVTSHHLSTSLLAPFIYLSAFAQGYSPASLAWDFAVPNTTSPSASSFHGPVTLREALSNNYGVPTQTLVDEVGTNNVAAVLRAAGFAAFRSPKPEAQALAQIQNGTQVGGLEAAMAFSTLSDLGIRAGKFSGGKMQPSALLFVSDEQDQILLDWSRPEIETITSPELAYLVTDVLSDSSVREQGPALSRPAALQPAVAETGEGTWAIGYSQQRVVVLWMKAEDEAIANDLWAVLFEAAHRDLPIQGWHLPGGLSSLLVCVPSGQLPDEDCPETRRELFLSGSEPRTSDTLFARAAINSLNGKLATVFTPDEFVEERLFLNAPLKIEAWAAAAGLPLLPADYDPLPGFNETAAIAIVRPEPFSSVSGTVDLLIRIGEGGVSYDMQVGQGLRPTQWIQITSSDEALGSEQLASWDTTGLSGLWAIQLQVQDASGALHRIYSIITVEQKDGPQ